MSKEIKIIEKSIDYFIQQMEHAAAAVASLKTVKNAMLRAEKMKSKLKDKRKAQ